MPAAHVNGLDIHYRIDGAGGGQTLLLINGVGDDLEGWAFQRDDFAAAGLRVVTFDNRGCGRSGQPPGPYTSSEMARDAKGLADALGLAPFHLAGVSIGGVIAQEYAVAWPGDLLSVVLASTYARPRPADLCGVRGVGADRGDRRDAADDAAAGTVGVQHRVLCEPAGAARAVPDRDGADHSARGVVRRADWGAAHP